MLPFTHIFNFVVPFRDSLLGYLSARDAALIAAVAGYALTPRERSIYLNPIRDMPEYQDWILEMLASGHTVTLVGQDVTRLFERMNDPLGYWERFDGRRPLTIWLAVIPAFNAVERYLDAQAVRQMFLDSRCQLRFVNLPGHGQTYEYWESARPQNEHGIRLLTYRGWADADKSV